MTEIEIETFIEEMNRIKDTEWTADALRTSSYGQMNLTDAIRARKRDLKLANNIEAGYKYKVSIEEP